MGSDDGCLHSNDFHLIGLLPNKVASVTRVLDLERWTRAEERTAQLIAHIQPDEPSWKHRNAIASYVQRLIAQCIPCVVFSYGSVPLKTYLPDGDIDLTVFSQDQNLNDNWAIEVQDMLQKEEKNEDAEYCIREVQLIHAEVKLVKCLVDNIVVDMSFNQLSGLCTLCFLEEVDRYIGQNHLFKRSIILIKAWCYYESRLLGAYHGLISTYALETLILYIFHVFNNSFAGPLEVLYRFLDFFSKFDWDNFYISLRGPVPTGSLPDMTADPPRQDVDVLFLDACSSYYSVPPSTHEIKERFVSKHFNIIDFLRTSNNLGRSVSKGNFFRVRSAFAFGSQRLAGLLDCPKECVVAELNRFFVNTWKRHGEVHRPDTRTLHASDIGKEKEHNVQKSNNKEANSIAFEKGDTKLNASRMSLNDGEKTGQSEVLQKVRFGHQFARTCSSPELTNPSSQLLREGISKSERGRQQDNSSGKTGHSRVADSHNVKLNAVDPSTRENSPSESYDGDVDSASTSSRCPVVYAVGKDISSGVKPAQKSANMMHSHWIQTFGRECAGFPSSDPQWNLNLYHPHGLPSVPITGRFDDDLQLESTMQVDDPGFWDDDVCSSIEQSTENGFIASEYMGRKQNPVSACDYASFPASTTEVSSGNSWDVSPLMRNKSSYDRLGRLTTMDPKPVVSDDNEVNGCKDGIPFSGAETTLPSIAIPHNGGLHMHYPTPVFLVPLYPCWPSATNNYPVFPVPFLPAGSADPYGSMPPYIPYTSQFKGKGNNLSVYHCPTLDTAKSIHQSHNSSKTKMINGTGSAEHSEECASDILSGDISSHLRNMIYGRYCQNLQFETPFYHPPIVPAQYLKGQFPLGEPGRSPAPTANDTVLSETSLMPGSHHHPNQRNLKGGYQYYPKGIPRHGVGTGTYFPNPRSDRDFQPPNPRYHRGNSRNHRKEQHKEREVNSNFNSRPRFGGRSRKWEKPNSRFDRSAARNHQDHLQWDAYGNYSHPTYHPAVYDRYMVYPCEPNFVYGSLEQPPADSANSSPDQPSSPSFKG